MLLKALARRIKSTRQGAHLQHVVGCLSLFSAAELWKNEDGQDLVEYSLLLAFIALAAVGLLSNVKAPLNGLWTTVNTTLVNAKTAAS